MNKQGYYHHHTDHFNEQDLSTIPSFALIKKLLAPKKSDKILDVGCGTGYMLRFITPKGGNGTGLDISKHAIKRAKTSYPTLSFDVGDATRLPYKDKQFDKIYSFNTIEHLDNQEQALQEYKRVLTPDGILVIGTNVRNSLSWQLFKLFLGGDPTHTREFSEQEFIEFVGSELTVLESKRSSCIARFSPTVNHFLQTVLRGDIIIKAKK